MDPDSLHRVQRSVQNEDALLSQSSLSNESLSNRYALFELLDPVLNDHDLRAAAGAYACLVQWEPSRAHEEPLAVGRHRIPGSRRASGVAASRKELLGWAHLQHRVGRDSGPPSSCSRSAVDRRSPRSAPTPARRRPQRTPAFVRRVLETGGYRFPAAPSDPTPRILLGSLVACRPSVIMIPS